MRVPFAVVVCVVGAFCSVVLWYSVTMIPADESILSTDFRDGMNVIADERAMLRQVVERPYDAQNPTGFPLSSTTTSRPATTTNTPTTSMEVANATISTS
ncbi:hypothetical protein H257_14088 [Aphanomyces astaci]|uniref:Transmembrane protein n=1 Tax=Aphanomyces astaci TaxID=112090 RepID=W4FTX8_APHAT|nr:hypothetical protein H257_14088 [Aphanomyces astaci]ETV70411.1 hypothetical protein H257_14088 [Aphanomyces astaci]|eukprot:XP_009840123.1 hypothetical protein H257_14088 [Aphanomyces astaci]